MIKIIYILLLFILSNCSLNQNSKFWTKSENINQVSNLEVQSKKEIFKKDEVMKNEFNKDIKIKLTDNIINKENYYQNTNNLGRVEFDGDLNKISRYKFSKIDNFYSYEPEVIFHKDNVIFFDNKGTILSFSNNSKLNWQKNYYNKSEKN